MTAGAIALADQAPSVGTFKDWNGIDSMEIKQLFRLADYALVKLVPFDTTAAELPKQGDNTYEPVVKALQESNDVILGALRDTLKTIRVEKGNP